MAIGTNDSIDKFGTQDTVTAGGGTSAVTAGSFSAAGDVVSGGWTNDDDAREASVVGNFTFGVAPAVNTSINLYLRLMDIDGTGDQRTPSANFRYKQVGAFLVDATTSAQPIAIDIELPNTKTSQVYEFYIENRTAQTLSAGWTLKVTPKAIGPHA